MNTKRFTTILALALATITAVAQSDSDQRQKMPLRESCTSIMVGKKASTDGSVITSHTCDSWYRTWMDMVPAKDYPRDTITTVWEGRMHTANAKDQTGMIQKGQIPQVSHTYKYLDTAYPCLNERQLAMGETTITGREILENKNGMFMIEELARIALERCSTAREAITLMGELIKRYGYGDSGECLTIADKNEVWIFEVFGQGPSKIGGVWAAVRIPDDHIAVSANISRIGALDLDDNDNYMASDNVFEVARKLKLWDGKSPFNFWQAYSGGNYYDEFKNYSVRELFIMNALAPSQHFNDQLVELPLSVRPDKPVSVQDVSRLLGSYYEGTELCHATRMDSLALPGRNTMVTNPWMRPDEINLYAAALGDTTMVNIRTISVSWCAYSTVIQLRSWLPDAVGGVAWVSLDNPGQSPRFPIYCGMTTLPDLLGQCGQQNYRDDTALWHYRRANRLATVRWGKYRDALLPALEHYTNRMVDEQQYVADKYLKLVQTDADQATKFLDNYSADFFGATITKWDELTRQFWLKSWGGF